MPQAETAGHDIYNIPPECSSAKLYVRQNFTVSYASGGASGMYITILSE
jgi:hypothetical protein